MGKNHRHKKQLKSEKAKTKFRVKNEKTKFLPKGLNVTKTDFKIKAIVLPEQLRSHGQDEVLSRRKLNIADILSRIKHYNTNVVLDSCEELIQMLGHHGEEIVGVHLSQVLHGVAPLILNKDNKIRKKCVHILDVIFKKTPSVNIEPFFSILSSYLRCSMTNIDRAVQEDSLLLLDILLRSVPNLVAKDAEKILTNMFSLISKLRSDSQPGRTLTVNLSGKLTSVKWRIQVLRRLHGFLSAMIDNKNDKIVQEKSIGIVKYAKDCAYVPLIVNPYEQNMINVNLFENSNDLQSNDVITRNLQTLMTLLYEIWMEVAPERDFKQTDTDSTLLKQETAAVLTCILHLLHLLLDHLSSNNKDYLKPIFTSDCQKFLKNIMQLFPFSQNVEKKQKDSSMLKLLTVNNDPKCIQENLLVCYLFCLAYSKPYGKWDVKLFENVFNYVKDCLSNRNYLTNTNTKFMLPIARTILFQNVIKDETRVAEFLNKFIHFYTKTGSHLESKDEFFSILTNASQLPYLNRCESYQKWLSNLPTILCREKLSGKILDRLLMFAKQNNELFLQSLVDNMQQILGNFEKIQIRDCENVSVEKLKILHLYYYALKLHPSSKPYFKKCSLKFGESYTATVNFIG